MTPFMQLSRLGLSWRARLWGRLNVSFGRFLISKELGNLELLTPTDMKLQTEQEQTAALRSLLRRQPVATHKRRAKRRLNTRPKMAGEGHQSGDGTIAAYQHNHDVAIVTEYCDDEAAVLPMADRLRAAVQRENEEDGIDGDRAGDDGAAAAATVPDEDDEEGEDDEFSGAGRKKGERPRSKRSKLTDSDEDRQCENCQLVYPKGTHHKCPFP